VPIASGEAYKTGTLTRDVVDEQAKLLWADALILAFPLWWFSMPAILKGWVERVYAYGFAYGVGEHSESHWGDRYGEGSMAGKRAMLVVSMGGWESHYSGRGVNGALDDLLFPIQHGVLFYPGFTVVPPFPIYKTSKMDAARFEQICTAYAARLDNLFIDQPLAFRRQNAGDYDIPALTLKPHLAPGRQDLGIHINIDGASRQEASRSLA
jgi:NAD(P)H dehydrogenase (quinone)